jgi:hypothetical protein
LAGGDGRLPEDDGLSEPHPWEGRVVESYALDDFLEGVNTSGHIEEEEEEGDTFWKICLFIAAKPIAR